MVRIWIALVPLLVLAACAGSKPGAVDEQGTTLVTYHRTGGIAAFDDELIVRENGKLSVKDRYGNMHWGHVVPGDLKTLRSILSARGFAELKGPYTSKGADQMTHVITLPSGKQVMGMDGAEWPAALTSAVVELDRLLGVAKGAG